MRPIQLSAGRRQAWNLHDDHKRIGRNALYVLVFVLIGRCAGALKEIAIAYFYGVSPIVDAFQLTFNLMTWVPSTLVSVLGIILVPLLVQVRLLGSEERALFLAELNTAVVATGCATSTLLYLAWPYALHVFAKSLSAESAGFSLQFAKGLAPLTIEILLIAQFSARLQAQEKHVNSMLECVPAATLLCAVVMFHRISAVNSLMLGTLVGFGLQALCLYIAVKMNDDIGAPFKLGFSSRHWPGLLHAIGLFSIGQIVLCLAVPVDQFFAVDLGPGAVATLGYTNRLLALILAVGALAIGRAILPVLTDVLQTRSKERAIGIAVRWCFVMFISGSIIVVLGWVGAPILVKLLFQRGAFTIYNTQTVATALRPGLLQIPFNLGMIVLMQMFSSLGKYRIMSVIAVFGFVTKIIANFLLVKMLGVEGILLATSIMYLSIFGAYLVAARRLIREQVK
ncbi:hypothetical protein A6V36_35775 [Paraburkholderia ginsengiterrae]|uniref:Virulence factor MviN n=2 Tax=Paraburkholderia ginsengiterrae TaxID=1462993 RepID=A0A1A9N082_9BURK|nr:hypothetical protein A6V37_35270 [Paraburkholderia ginsengiterrae]OAJ54724.1 hypothetical protein A6V36_35775 [Paraburkholderia ginsengiterrae]